MRTRVGLLASPLFVAAVVLLVVNDHFLKEHSPGLLTGKLSDVAGLFVVAVLLGVVSGSRGLAVALTAFGFGVLKTIPAVAALAPRILGGPSLIDARDLIALVVLLPMYWWFGRHVPDQPDDRRRVLGAVGGCVALLALTATPCGAPEQVVHLVRADDGSLLAGTGLYGKTDEWAASQDGRTWTHANVRPKGPFPTATSACVIDGTCFRVIPGERVESRAPGSPWRTAYRYTNEQNRRRDLRITPCAGAVPAFDSVLLAGEGDDQRVVVGMGPDGVLWHGADGRWERRAVLAVEPTRLDGDPRLADLTVGSALGAPLLLLIAAMIVRFVTGRWNRWLWWALAGATTLLLPAAMFMSMGFDYTVSGPLLFALAVVVLVAAGLLARFGPPPRPIAGWYQDPEDEEMLRWWD